MPERQTEQKIVSWFIQAKNLIKFSNDDKSYKLAENVIKANDFTKYPISKGAVVDIEIKEDQVVYLRKSKKENIAQEAPQAKAEPVASQPTVEEKKVEPESPKVEVKPEVLGDFQELTVYAVAGNKKVVKFAELKNEPWKEISEEIQKMDFASIGLQASKMVRVKFDGNKVIAIEPILAQETAQEASGEAKAPKNEAVAVKPENEASKTTFTPKPTQEKMTDKDAFYRVKELERQVRFLENNKQESIEIQCAVGQACNMVGLMAANIEPKPTASVINTMVEAISRANYKLIQELKSKG